MSLLPGRILPADTPIGKVNPDGTVSINHDYWLLLYNLCAQVLGTTTSGVPANPAQLLDGVDIDAADTDAVVLRRPIDNATILALEAPSIDPSLSPLLPLILQEEATPLGSLASFTGLANPSAKVALVAVNGSANTAMRSDAAPPLDVTISPNVTGNWTYTPASGAAISFAVGSTAATSLLNPSANATLYSLLGRSQAGPGIQARWDSGTTNRYIAVGQYDNLGAWSALMTLTNGASVAITGTLGINNATPPAQVTGWGTPTSPSVVPNFSGTAATTAQIQAAIAKIITDLKAFGLYGA